MVPAFAGGKRREITKTPRIHFYDVGLRNSLTRSLDPNIEQRVDRGAIAETLVFSEICKSVSSDWSVHFWRAKGGAEVDFVLVSGPRIIAVEVKSSAKAKLTRSSRSFIEAYSPEQFIMVTLDERDKVVSIEKNTRVSFIWLGELAGLLSVL
jgi:predicted AAA+ superfamily ATPase